jgi:TRAP-type C4-dicarboxylate transport system substrate-binding protein
MKKLLSIAVAAAFAASSFGAIAQDKKKTDVKSAQGGAVTTPDKGAVTTGTDKVKDKKGGELKNQGKRKNEKQRTEKK